MSDVRRGSCRERWGEGDIRRYVNDRGIAASLNLGSNRGVIFVEDNGKWPSDAEETVTHAGLNTIFPQGNNFATPDFKLTLTLPIILTGAEPILMIG